MATTGGYGFWPSRPFKAEFVVDGTTCEFTLEGLSFSESQQATEIPTQLGTSVVQHIWRGGTMPLDLAAETMSFTAVMDSDEEYFALRRAKQKSQPVQMCMLGDVREDVWSVSAKNTGQTTWKTSRPLAYSATFTQALYPPVAYIDSTALTVVTGAPASGELKIPATSAATATDPSDTITSHSSLAGSFLIVRYHPRPYVLITELGRAVPTFNELRVSVTLREILAGSYTLLA